MYTELLPEVVSFVQRSERQYLDFLDDVKRAAESMRRGLGSDVVREIYSRKAKQGSEFKTSLKIAKALEIRRKLNRFDPPYTVDDIVGVTIIVYYPDQLKIIADWLRTNHGLDASIVKDKPVDKDGYYAHHLVFEGRGARYPNLSCEVQIKTMLHDAWAAKGHDLNYKPHGKTDKRLSRMMQLFGDALESIEVQSEVLRNLIHERWNAEHSRRQLARRAAWNILGKTLVHPAFDPDAVLLLEEIKKAASPQPVTSADLKTWSQIDRKIFGFNRELRRERVWLAVSMAMVSSLADHVDFASREVNDFLRGTSSSTPQDPIYERDILNLPLGLSACGDFGGAIAISQYCLDQKKDVSSETVNTLKFNLANYLIEEACFSAPKESAELDSLRSRIESLIQGCAEIEATAPSAFRDLRGMVEVALSDDPEKLRQAIDQIYQSMQAVPPLYSDYAKSYLELHLRVAWRRLLEVEAERSANP